MNTTQVVLGLLRALDEGGPDEQCFAAHRLAALLEVEEAKYRAVVGDPHANPSLRNHYAIGKILAFIKVGFWGGDGGGVGGRAASDSSVVAGDYSFAAAAAAAAALASAGVEDSAAGPAKECRVMLVACGRS